ncbi:MAG: CHAT domain-containing protein [Phaeodactylibacter sp.]|nr:CHAT domain-containing protein [Phaeodactylibacter sp.]MCB9051700.1 CHAT domain-containing protein [Lewinellaceae bacterium]
MNTIVASPQGLLRPGAWILALFFYLSYLPFALAQPPGDWLGMAGQAYRSKQFDEAVRIVEEGLPVLEAANGKDTNYVELLVLGGRAWYQLHDLARAEQVMLEALSLREQLQGKGHSKYIKEAFNLATIYRNSGDAEKYQQGKALLWDTYNALREQPGADPADEGRLVRGLGNFLIEGGEYEALEAVCQAFLLSVRGREAQYQQDVVQVRYNLARAAYDQGLWRNALPLFEQNLAEARQAFGPNHLLSARPLRALAVCHLYLGQYGPSEAWFREALSIYEEIYGKQDLNYHLLASDYAKLYLELGWPEAEGLLLETLHQLDTLSRGNPSLTEETRYNLGIYYLQTGNYAAAEPYLLKSNEYFCNTLGQDNMLCLHSTGQLTLLDTGWKKDFQSAKRRLLPLAQALQKTGSPAYASVLNLLGRTCFLAGEWGEARRYSLEALELYRRHFGAHFNKEESLLSRLSLLAFREQNRAAGMAYFQKMLEAAQWRINMGFAIASDAGRQQVVEGIRQTVLKDFGPLLYQEPEWREALAPAMLEWSIFSKSLLERAQAKVHQFGRHGQGDIAGIYQEWLATRERLSQLHGFSRLEYPQQEERIEALQEQSGLLEKELSRHFSGFADWEEALPASWQQLRASLQGGEALVDILKLPAAEGEQALSYYVAFILNGPRARAPEIVVFPEGQALENRLFRLYFLDVSSRNAGLEISSEPYAAFWAPLEPFLKGARTVYWSPDGVFHKINPSALRRPDGAYLLDHYDIRALSHPMATLQQGGTQPPLLKKALLLANPTFPTDVPPDFAPDAPRLAALPFTEQEMEDIGQLLEQEGWAVQRLVGEEATEAAVKQAGPVGVLHLATHGYFQQQGRAYGRTASEITSAPLALLQSMLFLAGGQRRYAAPETEDGVLTAYEVMGLPLEGAELAVLSACRSGQGELADGEGVYGFQRALRIAGVRATLLSLWDVEDKATAEWMAGFYRNWLSGLPKFEAYQAAQRAMREKYGLPFYWAGFIFSGE